MFITNRFSLQFSMYDMKLILCVALAEITAHRLLFWRQRNSFTVKKINTAVVRSTFHNGFKRSFVLANCIRSYKTINLFNYYFGESVV